MMTVMVLKIPQPETMTFSGIWELKVMYFAYFVSFIVLLSIWDHHRKLFFMLEDINNRVIWMYAILIFLITLIPYFTAWVAQEPFSLVPELMFGLIFFLVNIIYVLCTKVAIKNDVHNEEVNGIEFKELMLINILLFILGTVLALLGYPIALMIMCLLTLITWNVIPHIQKTYVVGE